MRQRLANRRLYIADLARRQSELENGRIPMDALAYRVLAKRMRSALAGLPAPRLMYGFAELEPHLQPLVYAALEQRHFDETGMLLGPQGRRSAELAEALLARLQIAAA